MDYASELFDKYDIDGDNALSLKELQRLMSEAAKDFPHLQVGTHGVSMWWL